MLGDPDSGITTIINNFIDDGTLIGGETLEALTAVFAGWTPAILLFVFLMPLVFLSVIAFWRFSASMFMLSAGAGVATGLAWYDVYTTNWGLAIGIMLMAYGLVCLGFAFRCIFWKDRLREE